MESNYFKLSNFTFPWKLDPYSFIVYSYLSRCSNNNKSAFPSYKTIGEQCNISRRKAIDSVQALEDNGLLSKDHRFNEKGENVSNTYEVVHIMHYPVQDMHYPSAQYAPNKELSYKEIEKKKKEYVFLEKDDHPFISIYLNHFEERFKRKHKKVTIDAYHEIMRCIEEAEEVDEDTFEEGVIEHFDELPKSNDGSMLPFTRTFMRRYTVQTTI